MLTAKRAGARLGYPTPLQQRAVLEKRDKEHELNNSHAPHQSIRLDIAVPDNFGPTNRLDRQKRTKRFA
jgi:hypothetical protein